MQTISAADYADIVRVEDPRVAPDGDRVAFLRRVPRDDETEESTVYVVPIGGDEPRQFTASEGVDAHPRWRPDGSWLAFASDRGEGDRDQLWALPVDGGEARRLTSVVGGIDRLEWSPDGSRLCFAQRVTADDRETGRDLAVAPDYERDDPDPRVIDRTVYRAGTEYLDGRYDHVYVLDFERALADGSGGSDGPNALDSTTEGAGGGGTNRGADDTGGGEGSDDGAITRLTDGDVDHVAPTWGDDGTVYYARRVGEDPDDSLRYEVCAHDLASDAVDAVAETTGWLEADSLAGTAGRVAFEFTPEEKLTMRQTEIRVYDEVRGTALAPTEPLDRTVGHRCGFAWGPAGETLYFTTPDEGSQVCWAVPGDASEDPRRIYGDGVTVEDFSVGEDAVAVVQSEWDHPGDVFVTTRGGNELHRLTRVNADYLADRAVRQPEEVWFDAGEATAQSRSENASGENDDEGASGENGNESASGENEAEGTAERGGDRAGGARDGGAGPIQGWLLTPPEYDADASPGETYPLMVEIHGGPHAHWTTAGTMWHEFQTLAARGYCVFWCNPRGSTGYGEARAMAIERDWGDVTLSDVLAGVEAVCAREYVDEDEVFVTGGSFGGYATAWAVARTDRFRAAVAQRGVYDLIGFYGSSDAYKLVEDDFGTIPWEDPDLLWDRSPIAHVDAVEAPTLLLHADRDFRTPANTAELFHRGLRTRGVDTRLVRYPREGHELSRSGEPGHVVDRLERIARWFDGYSTHHDALPALEREPNAGLSRDVDA